jgi:hypothetical protein
MNSRQGRARILGLEPVDERFDAVDVLVGEVVLRAEPRRHVANSQGIEPAARPCNLR